MGEERICERCQRAAAPSRGGSCACGAMLSCEKCGVLYKVGEDYRCPHGAVAAGGVIDDTLPGGARYLHNLGDAPVWCETKTQYRAELAKRGLVQQERGSYNRDDRSPWATRTCLRPGARDPFLHRA